MTALTPMEQATVTRFGIHDDDVIADMELRGDDTPRCAAKSNSEPCGLEASHTAVCSKCGIGVVLICLGHAITFGASRKFRRHRHCGNAGETRLILRVVPL